MTHDLLLQPTHPSGTPKAPEERATAFQPVVGGAETRSGAVLLVQAYALVWCIPMVWLLLLWRKQKALFARLDELERAIDKAATGPRDRG
jgi:hypothetical protein